MCSVTLPVRRVFLVVVCFVAVLGCSTKRPLVRKILDRSAAKATFVSWNARSLFGTPREATHSKAFAIASLSQRELAELMTSCPAPQAADVTGKWYGINKGFAAAIAGMPLDIKVINEDCCAKGYNILVEPVAIDQLPCRGWQPKIDFATCKPKTLGNFVVVPSACCNEPLKLDYTIADNRWADPSRFLIDEIVAIEPDLLLGRANAKLGMLQIPVAYFVLIRADCHHGSCDAETQETTACSPAIKQLPSPLEQTDEACSAMVLSVEPYEAALNAAPNVCARPIVPQADSEAEKLRKDDSEPSASDRNATEATEDQETKADESVVKESLEPNLNL